MSQKHMRTVEIAYPFGFSSSEKELLNLELFKHNIVNLDKWDTEIPTYEPTEYVETSSVYHVDVHKGEDGEFQLSFDYKSDARKIIKQLTTMMIPCTDADEIEVVNINITKIREPQWRGSTILFLDAPHHLGSYSRKFHIVSENEVGEVNVKLYVDFTAYGYSSTLTFTAEWDTERVQKANVIEQHLVDLPTPMMGKIQSIFESVFYSDAFDKKTDEPIISCKFDVVSKHSSECKPSVIEMLKEARDNASSANEEE